jgi:pyruvate dehydrogenase E2 component (dihydrolipoamide acetyltransferase)
MSVIDIIVPDIGGYDDVPVIEVLVHPGDTIALDAPLVTLESEKATMDVPATSAGTVKAVKVKVGDKVSAGSALVSLEVADAAQPAPAAAAPAPAAAAPAAPVAPAAPAAASAPAPAAPAASSDGAVTVTELKVPDIGGFTGVPIVTVFVKAGDVVAQDGPVVEIESEKATMEVPASAGGRIRDVKVRVGDKVSQGDVLALVETSGAAAPASVAASTPPAAGPPPTAASSLAPALANEPAPPIPAPAAASNGAAHQPVAAATSVHASPAIRRFARELGVELSGVSGTGPNGRVTREDVQGFVKRTLTESLRSNGAAAGAPALAGLPPWPKVDFAKFGPVERVALSRIKRISGPMLARNWVMIPHVTQHDDADVTDLEAFRQTINAEQKDVKVTMLALLVKAVVACLKAFPDVNSSLDGEDLVQKKYYHVGFAADTPNGLLVPVIHDADKKGLLEIARETGDLAKKARDGKLGPAEMSGGCFSISSLGGIGGTYFTPIVNAPEVAILGASRTSTKPVWDGKAFVPRTIMPLSFSYDHRVIDGAQAARFTTYLVHVLADMRRTLL